MQTNRVSVGPNHRRMILLVELYTIGAHNGLYVMPFLLLPERC
jgi:hypothetical protein